MDLHEYYRATKAGASANLLILAPGVVTPLEETECVAEMMAGIGIVFTPAPEEDFTRGAASRRADVFRRLSIPDAPGVVSPLEEIERVAEGIGIVFVPAS